MQDKVVIIPIFNIYNFQNVPVRNFLYFHSFLPPFQLLLNKYANKFYLSASDGNIRRFFWFFEFRCCLHFRFGSSRFRFRGGCFRFGGSHLWVRMHHCRLSVKIRAVSFKSK
jgi:hypothetical protein